MKQPNYREASAQKRLMQEQGFRLCQRKAVSRLPRAYITPDGQWRISTAPRGVWKLEKFRCYIMIPGVGKVMQYTPVMNPRFETPLAMALWFNMLRRMARLGAIKL